MANDESLTLQVGPEYAMDLLTDAMAQMAVEAATPKKVRAVLVRMAPYAYSWSPDSIRKQAEKAFPGVPVIFVDQGTDIEVIHAAE